MESTRNDAERAAVQELRALTYGAAGLIRPRLPKARTTAKSRLLVPTTGRTYEVRLVPFAASRTELAVMRQSQMRRLVVSDNNRPDRWARGRFAVLDPLGFCTEDGSLRIRLFERGQPGSRKMFSRALGADHVRFWLDMERDLGEKLVGILKSDEQSRLNRLRERARRAIPIWLSGRRETLQMGQHELADIAQLTVAEIARIESENGIVIPETLNLIEVAFNKRADEMRLLELDDPSEPDEPAFVVSEDVMRKALHAAGIPLGRFRSEQVRLGEMPVRAATSNGHEMPPLREITSADEVRELRNSLGVSQVTLAKEARMSPSVVCMVETGKREITPDIRQRISIALENIAASQNRTLA